jgi:hypothetical protein
VHNISISITTPVVSALKNNYYYYKMPHFGLSISRSPNGFFFVLLDPGGGFASKTAVRRFQN